MSYSDFMLSLIALIIYRPFAFVSYVILLFIKFFILVTQAYPEGSFDHLIIAIILDTLSDSHFVNGLR